MTRFSANLGLLWQELSLPDAIYAASEAGFDAVECHWPYGTDPAEVKRALARTGLPMLSINTSRGEGFGLSALPDHEAARQAIDQAFDYASQIGARFVHVMAGTATGEAAHQAFVASLRYGLARSLDHGIAMLIEPLNPHDAPGYFLNSATQAADIITEIDSPALRLMFDCYHIARIHNDVSALLTQLLPMVAHIQIASVPARAEPDCGTLAYGPILAQLDASEYAGFVGAEYHPRGTTEAGLGWLQTLD